AAPSHIVSASADESELERPAHARHRRARRELPTTYLSDDAALDTRIPQRRIRQARAAHHALGSDLPLHGNATLEVGIAIRLAFVAGAKCAEVCHDHAAY